jgi:hypothetical protein
MPIEMLRYIPYRRKNVGACWEDLTISAIYWTLRVTMSFVSDCYKLSLIILYAYE